MTRAPRPRILTPGEVAAIFRVDVRTVARWSRSQHGRPPVLPSFKTPGGHRRFREEDVARLLRSAVPSAATERSR